MRDEGLWFGSSPQTKIPQHSHISLAHTRSQNSRFSSSRSCASSSLGSQAEIHETLMAFNYSKPKSPTSHRIELENRSSLTSFFLDRLSHAKSDCHLS
ncbi:hypothetical protein KFK09_017706 [Dendrobium nobile]|uniref:Uncharacterized protein n=1 Tax=Dendrobium nobile TaxID=94219 RepID=A0A8T3AUV3_DENNO|nr:hypothetical protein KFK09_017706 [Dendrobium nobile]